jgi:hypothetical protein
MKTLGSDAKTGSMNSTDRAAKRPAIETKLKMLRQGAIS